MIDGAAEITGIKLPTDEEILADGSIPEDADGNKVFEATDMNGGFLLPDTSGDKGSDDTSSESEDTTPSDPEYTPSEPEDATPTPTPTPSPKPSSSGSGSGSGSGSFGSSGGSASSGQAKKGAVAQ